ncbi:MAG: metal-dependent transcriptional regulator [Desulfovibrionales bacterium]|nr:metal-dependent transcriptional regulator [Desulfovibrionales bacterium]
MSTLSSSLEDYLEVIFTLESQYSEARAKDIADAMSVQRASVTNALQKLAQLGLINYQPYASVTLTPEGFRIATRVAHRHKVLFDFLHSILGIRPDQAEETACKLEHSFDDESLDALIRFVRFIKTCPRTGPDWLAAFARPCTERGSCDACVACIAACLEGQGRSCPKDCAADENA